MHSHSILTVATGLISVVAGLSPRSDWNIADRSGNTCALTESKSKAIAQDYIHIWNTGNFSTISEVIAPNIVVYQDRIPSGTGKGGSFVLPINNSSAWEAFVTDGREDWKSYTFDVLYHFFQEDRIAIRWLAEDVSNHTGLSRNVPVGKTVKYNGTDLLTLDGNCLIAEVDSAQNYIQEFHGLKINLGVV